MTGRILIEPQQSLLYLLDQIPTQNYASRITEEESQYNSLKISETVVLEAYNDFSRRFGRYIQPLAGPTSPRFEDRIYSKSSNE